MATKKENAALLLDLLKVSIDADKPEPKAETLQDWADRAGTAADAVRLEVLGWQAQKATGLELPADHTLTAEQLQGWVDRSGSELDVVKSELQNALDPSVSVTGPLVETPIGTKFNQDEETFHVKISEANSRHGGTITDPEQPKGHRVISTDPVEVRSTHVIRGALANGSLVTHKD